MSSSLPEIKNLKCKKRSSSAWVMFGKDGAWVDIREKQVLETLHAALDSGKAMVDVEVEGKWRRFDFLRMLQTDMDTGVASAIAWVDVNAQRFFPETPKQSRKKVLINASSPPKKKRSVLDRRNGKSCDLKEKTDESLEVCSSITAAADPPRWPDVVRLPKEDAVYKSLESMFLAGVKRFDPCVAVTGIHKCLYTSPLAASRLNIFETKAQATKAVRGTPNLKLSWFGAPANSVAGILTHGVGLPNYKCFGRNAHGLGVHLSPSHLSAYPSSLLSTPDENGERHIVLCKVIAGNPEHVPAGSPQFHPSSEAFDSGVDDLQNTRWLVVWSTHMNTHILPVFVVSFKSSRPLPQPTTNGLAGKASSPANNNSVRLFAELRKSLTEPQMRTLEMQLSKHKEKKLSKEDFMTFVRCLVGDNLLRSTIRKISEKP